MLDRKMENFVLNKLRPLSIVDDPSFEDLVTSLEPQYEVFSRTTLTSRLHKRHGDMKNYLTNLLPTLPSCAITHDGWTSIAMQSYCSLTLHFITNDWELKNICLQVKELPGSHTAENIKESLLEAKKTWKFPEPIAVTDNAANEVKTFSLLKWERISCFGHNLNLAVRAALNVPDMEAILAKCRKLINYFHKSAIATRVLKDKQNQIFPEKKEKRWSETSQRA